MELTKIRKIMRWVTVFALFAISIAFGATVFKDAYLEFGKMCGKTLQRVVFYFCKLFNIDVNVNIPVIVPPVSGSGSGAGSVLPIDPSYLGARFEIWGNMLISKDTYIGGGYVLADFVIKSLQLTTIIVPIFILTWFLIKKAYFKINNKHGIDTFPLRWHNKLSKILYTPITNNARDTKKLFADVKEIKILIILIWAFNFNVSTIFLDFISFYLYFTITFNFIDLYYLLLNIVASLKYLAMGGGFFIALGLFWLFCKWRKKHALNRLETMEEYNMAVVAERGKSTYKYGEMGCGKTLLMTDQALTCVVSDLQCASEDMAKCRKMFPFFPWLLFELEIEERIDKGLVKNWAQVVDFVDSIKEQFEKTNNIFGYDFKKYGLIYYNGLDQVYLFNVLRDYARLHEMYIRYDSFIISNYPIREDRVMLSVGNSVMWNNSFFDFENKNKDDSIYSKILNFDILRMCKTFKDVAINKSLNYGVICITEDDKEQFNALEGQADKIDSPYPNPKNDGITKTEKFLRHYCTVMGRCYLHLFKDGQRVMSINADTREIATMEKVNKPGRDKSTLLFFFVDKFLYKFFDKIYSKFEEKIRYFRGDNTLLMHLLKSINKLLYANYHKKYNRYTYRVAEIELESGTLDGNKSLIKYYLMHSKIFNDRYNTATHEKFFQNRMRQSGCGLSDYQDYDSLVMTDAEFDAQNSYSRMSMVDSDWRQPYIDAENLRIALSKAEIKEKVNKKEKKN